MVSPFSPDACLPAPRIVCATRAGEILIFDAGRPPTDPRPETFIRAHSGPAHALLSGLAGSPLSPHAIVSGGAIDGALRAFDPRLPAARGRRILSIPGVHPSGGIAMCTAIHTRPHLIATTGGADGSVRFVDVRTKRVLVSARPEGTISRHSSHGRRTSVVGAAWQTAYALLPMHNGSLVCSWGDGRISVHHPDAPDRVHLHTLDGISNALRCLSLLPGEGTSPAALVAAGDDGIVCSIPLSAIPSPLALADDPLI
ncbi:hypothetical protein HK105_202505 [Polyrhizophydium stewartii]|uniref:WD40 repeat domain-containing protein n=1 Tax=Polyrhizophydium stewartii TaxID=2732419 RepID=A0ABR4NF61_9FUNG